MPILVRKNDKIIYKKNFNIINLQTAQPSQG